MNKFEKIASMYGVSDSDLEHLDVSGRSINRNLFGDPLSMSYPLHTKEACVASMAEFLYDRNMDNTVRSRITKAANHYGVNWPCLTENKSLVKVSYISDGKSYSMEFSPTKAGINKAASELFSQRKHMAWEPCQYMAKQLLKTAYETKQFPDNDIEDRLMKTAGYCVGDKESALKAIAKRAQTKSKSKEIRNMQAYMDKLASELPETVDHEMLAKIATVLDAYDALSNGREHYDTYTTPPELEVFSKTAIEVVDELEDHLLIPSVGASVSKSDLKKQAAEVIQALDDMGIYSNIDDMCDKVSRLSAAQADHLFGRLS